jgi:hypothetical protein
LSLKFKPVSIRNPNSKIQNQGGSNDPILNETDKNDAGTRAGSGI